MPYLVFWVLYLLNFNYPYEYKAGLKVLHYILFRDKSIPRYMLESFNVILQNYNMFKTGWLRDLVTILSNRCSLWKNLWMDPINLCYSEYCFRIYFVFVFLLCSSNFGLICDINLLASYLFLVNFVCFSKSRPKKKLSLNPENTCGNVHETYSSPGLLFNFSFVYWIKIKQNKTVDKIKKKQLK